VRVVVYVLIALILASLACALVFAFRDRSGSKRAVKALAVRVALSITLFLFLTAVDYDPRLSGATNYGPNHPEHLATVAERAKAYRQANGLDANMPIPVDAVTVSASGLDPHISVANARLQAARVAQERELPLEQVLALIEEQTSTASVTYLSDSTVNVLQLNLALDDR